MSSDFLVKQSVLLILPAEDFNEQEFLVISSQLERANLKIFIASDAHSVCIGSAGLKVKNDVSLYNMHETNFAGIIFIGGNGARNYWNNKNLHNIAQKFYEAKKVVGAICSAPLILAKAGLLKEKATCYTDDINELEREGIEYQDIPVHIDNKIITAQNPAAAVEFASSFIHFLTKQ